jgi:hypothetical protein
MGSRILILRNTKLSLLIPNHLCFEKNAIATKSGLDNKELLRRKEKYDCENWYKEISE